MPRAEHPSLVARPPADLPHAPSADETLIKYAYAEDIWFHVDKLSSAHVYLRLAPWMGPWDKLHEAGPTTSTLGGTLAVVMDCAQLTKANSIEGNKKNNVTVIYTPASNLQKDGSMATGAVGFKNEKLVRRVHVPERNNAIVNRCVTPRPRPPAICPRTTRPADHVSLIDDRLNKTKRTVEVDHEADRVERDKALARIKREQANATKNAELALARQRKAETEAKSYKDWGEKKREMTYEEEEEEWQRAQKEGTSAVSFERRGRAQFGGVCGSARG